MKTKIKVKKISNFIMLIHQWIKEFKKSCKFRLTIKMEQAHCKVPGHQKPALNKVWVSIKRIRGAKIIGLCKEEVSWICSERLKSHHLLHLSTQY